MTSLIQPAPQKEARLEAIETLCGQELRPILVQCSSSSLKQANGILQNYDREPTRAKMTIKGTSYFKAARHHLIVMNF